MDKPTKKKGIKYRGEINKCSSTDRFKLGYNQACENWELCYYNELDLLNLKLYDRLDRLNKANKVIIKLRKKLAKK